MIINYALKTYILNFTVYFIYIPFACMDKLVTEALTPVDKSVSLVSVSTSHILMTSESPAQIKWHDLWSQCRATIK